MSSKLTRILDFIICYKSTHDGNAPAMREIMAACGVASTSTMSALLDELAKQNRIVIGKRGESRTIQVVGGKWIPAGAPVGSRDV